MIGQTRVIATEEHVVTPGLIAAWRRLEPEWRDAGFQDSVDGPAAAGLLDLGEGRIAAMDARGLDVAVLSLTTPGVQSLSADEAVRLQTEANDLIAEAVRGRPDRFQGLATLATPDPVAATQELERAVTKLGLNGAMLFGRTRDHNMDDPIYWPIYEAAAALRVPLYLLRNRACRRCAVRYTTASTRTSVRSSRSAASAGIMRRACRRSA